MKTSILLMGAGSCMLALPQMACSAASHDDGSPDPETTTRVESLGGPGRRGAVRGGERNRPHPGHHHRPRVCQGASGGHSSSSGGSGPSGGPPGGGPSSGGSGPSGGSTGGGPSNEACALTVDDGALSSECSSVAGHFYTYVDEGHSSITPAEYDETTDGRVCASGTAAQVLDDQYEVYWGSGVGVSLVPDVEGASPYDATSDGVIGFGFTITGVPVAGELRFDVHDVVDDSIYCVPFTLLQEGYNEILFADLAKNCWAPEPETPDVTQLHRLQWQVVTNTTAPYDYDFCIADLVALK